MTVPRRYELTDEEWERIRKYYPEREAGQKGRPRNDDRQMLNGVLWIARIINYAMSMINPSVLLWARKDAALSLSEAAFRLGFRNSSVLTAEEKLSLIEQGDKEVSKSQLEKMARIYRKSLLTLYSSSIPKTEKIATDFRKRFTTIKDRDDALLRSLILEIKIRQSILNEAYTEEEELSPLGICNKVDDKTSTLEIIKIILEETKFNLEKFRSYRSVESAFNYARSSVESTGIFVLLAGDLGNYHSKLSTDVFRGFSLADEHSPFIVINPNDARGALVFTLFHEMVHISMGESVISNGNDLNETEKRCDRVAQEILISSVDLNSIGVSIDDSVNGVLSKIDLNINNYNVSYGSIAYNLFKNGFISNETYQEVSKFYKERYDESRRKEKQKNSKNKSGPTYSILKNFLNGKKLTGAVGNLMRSGDLSISDASRVLGINVANLYSLLSS
jgi:Zn-dependent peptidase ImmA (M78 family)